MRLAPVTFAAMLVVAVAPFAAAQVTGTPSARPHPHHVHPVAAPSFEPANDHAKAVEEEGAPGPFKLWDTKIFSNEQPPYAALLFNFALLAYIYYRFGKKPVADALKSRKVGIATAIENAQRILREAKERSKRYRHKLEKVQDDAEQGKLALASTGKGEAEMIVRAANDKATRLKREAECLVQQEQKQTELDLLRETVEKATKEAEELLRKNVSAADQERLADEFIAKLATDFENTGLRGAS
jgi:F0F1-type ATP synthase membrane subunit b/b'